MGSVLLRTDRGGVMPRELEGSFGLGGRELSLVRLGVRGRLGATEGGFVVESEKSLRLLRTDFVER